MPETILLDMFQRLGMALALGFLVGIERGWKHREAPEGSRAAGLRTHALIGLTGGVAAALMPWIGEFGFAALTLAFAAAFITFKVRESFQDNDISATGTIAGVLVYALGAYAMWGDLRVAAAAGVALVALLAFKEALHAWLDKITWKELRSALLILAATLIALPVLPDRAVDPWGAINPRELWLLTILVAGASFAGYIAVRVLGPDVGVLAGATAGAFVSSTVVTAELGRRVKAGEAGALTAAVGAMLAAAVSVARTFILLAIAALAVLGPAGPALATGALVFLAMAFALRAFAKNRAGGDNVGAMRSPLVLSSVAMFALLLGGVIVLGRLISDTFGQAGLLPFAATAGLADVDAVTLAAASLSHSGLDSGVAAQAVLAAVLVNTFAKGAIAVFTGGWRYGALYLGASVAASGAAAAVWLFAPPLLTPMFSPGASLPPAILG